MQFTPQSINNNFLIKVRLSAICLCGLIITGCTSSDDPASTLPVPPSSVQAGIYDSTVVEGADDLEFVVSLSSASSEIVSVDYETINGTAVAGTDYSAANGTVQFAPGEVRKFITVAVLNNVSTSTGSSNNMQLVLSSPQHAELSDNTA
ncbi:MAG: hypothetical protein DRQ44_08450, partial [Gammaproteobacteria bacterium]